MARLGPFFLLLMIAALCHAGAPGDAELDKAIRSGDFAGYHDSACKWLNTRIPADISEQSMKALLKDPALLKVLAQKQLIAKIGAGELGRFAKAAADNAGFVSWIMKNTEIMELYLEGATPIGIRHRDEERWSIQVKSLEIWKKIYLADDESRKGLYLKLAIATGLNPPGTADRGVGQAEKPGDPLDRYRHFKAAHKNGELFPSFDKLTVWDYRQVVSSNASNQDLAWGREMINTWRPDLRAGEKVVLSTGRVWRRGSPYGYKNNYASVMEGGGKCGPRSSWAIFICQAFGIPAAGVRQPGHVCVTWKSPEGKWVLGYGRGWDASKVMGLSGREYIAATEARRCSEEFSQVEHLRWFASALTSKDKAGAIMAVAKKISKAVAPEKVDLAGRFEGSKGLPINPKAPEFKEEAPIKVPEGVIHIEAEKFAKMGGRISYGGLQVPGVCVHNCYTGGKQIHFQCHMQSAWVEYQVNLPEAGTYGLEMRVSLANRDQVLDLEDASSVPSVKKAAASNIYRGQERSGPKAALDGNPDTRWATDGTIKQAWLEVDLGRPTEVSKVQIIEAHWDRVRKFKLEYRDGGAWKTILEGGKLGNRFEKQFDPVKAQHFRLNILESTGGPTLCEFKLSGGDKKPIRVKLKNSYGLWSTTPPVDLKLGKGPQTLRISTPFQRGVTMRWLRLKLKK